MTRQLDIDLHTILRVPTGIFHARGVTAKEIFLDNRATSPDTQTGDDWYYDYRTNAHHTLKKPLRTENLAAFVACCNSANHHDRKPTWSEA